jgi:hypothetical protein
MPARVHWFTFPKNTQRSTILKKGFIRMANENLKGKKVAILVTDDFEQVELLQPREALDKAGAETKVVSPKDGPVKSWT